MTIAPSKINPSLIALLLLSLLPGAGVCQDVEISHQKIEASRDGYDIEIPKGDEEEDSGAGFKISLPKKSPLWRLYGQYGDCREYLIFQAPPAGKGSESVFGISPFNTLLATHWENSNTLIAYYYIAGMYGRAGLKSQAEGSNDIPLKQHDCLRAKIQIAPNGDLSVEKTTFSFQEKWLIIGDVMEASPKAHKELAARCKSLRNGPGIHCQPWNSSEIKDQYQTLAFPGLAPNKTYLLLAVEHTREQADATLKRLKAAKVTAYLKKIN
jgi:hypothetical protein